jgi:peptide/nickel transport system permease protein
VSTEPSAERGPWSLALRRFLRNRLAVAFLFLFVLIVAFVMAAPLWVNHVAHTGPNEEHTVDTVTVDGEEKDVVTPEGKPIGPQLFGAGGKFFLGADSRLGRDEMVRLMYGGRTSLQIGITAALIATILAVVLALLSGYFGGWIDFVITRFFDLFYAFPVVLLGIALGSALAINGFHHFGVNIESGSIWIPTLVISYVLIPYVGRPLRGQVLSLREKEFVEAAISQGASPLRVMFSELLPNITSSVLVFFTLIIANNIVLEAALSFLGAGVQPPTPSWGTLISDGQNLIVTRPWLALAPGIAIVLTVLSLNVFGDGLRDALDPRAKVKIEH